MRQWASRRPKERARARAMRRFKKVSCVVNVMCEFILTFLCPVLYPDLEDSEDEERAVEMRQAVAMDRKLCFVRKMLMLFFSFPYPKQTRCGHLRSSLAPSSRKRMRTSRGILTPHRTILPMGTTTNRRRATLKTSTMTRSFPQPVSLHVLFIRSIMNVCLMYIMYVEPTQAPSKGKAASTRTKKVQQPKTKRAAKPKATPKAKRHDKRPTKR